MATILGLSGSLRRTSFNTALLRAAVELMPEGSSLVIGSIEGVPLYDGDLESDKGLPEAVVRLKDKIRACDGLLLVTPEYNNSIPGVFKNAIDWASRPSSDIKSVFGGRPVAITGASLGAFGTLLSQSAWLPVLRTLGMRLWPAQMLVPRASEAFDDAGTLTDPRTEERLRKFLAGFVAFVEGGSAG